ncbi:MAG: DUF4870 domain-containing protein [Flavobacteriaceae bacterium]
MKEDRQLLVLMHLSQLIDLITGIGGLLVPLILWSLKKDEVLEVDQHGKAIINFQLSMILYAILAFPLLLLLGLGIVVWIVVGLFCLIYPIINAVRASSGQLPYYPLSIPFVK